MLLILGIVDFMNKNLSNEYLYFKCKYGHDNYIFQDPDDKERLQKEQIVVSCQHCDWKSEPFQPELFQHSAHGNFLLWVYTTKNVNAVNSILNLEINSAKDTPHAENIASTDQKNIELVETSVVNENFKKILESEPSKIQAKVSADKKRAVTIKMQRMTPDMLKEDSSNEAGKDKSIEIQTPITKVKKKENRHQTIKMERMVRSPIKEDFLKNLASSQKKEIPKKEISATNNENIVSLEEKKEDIPSIDDTIELNIADLDLKSTSKIVAPIPMQHDRIKLQQNYFVTLMLNFLWLFAFAAFAVLAYHFIEQQNDKITLALKSVQGEIANIEFPEFPDINLVAPKEPKTKVERKWKDEYRRLYKEYRIATKSLKREKTTSKNKKDNYNALLVTYRETEKKNTSLHQNLQKLKTNNYELQEKLTLLQRQLTASKKQKTQTNKVSIPTKKAPQTTLISLTQKEKDFHLPSLSKNGKFIIFYDDEDAGRKKVRRYLKLAFLNQNKISKVIILFQTPIVKLRNREIPFIYDWNGENRIILLTRVKGINTIHRLRLKINYNTQQVSTDKKQLIKVTYPEVLGPPSLSPNQQYFSCVHANGNQISVKIYDMLDGRTLHSTSGGGDTLRSPVWGQKSRHVLFVSSDRKGIATWEFPRSKRVKNLPYEVYGRYLSISPQGNQILFFQNTAKGKGSVDICMWDWQNFQAPINTMVKNIRSTETCNIKWLDDYFVYIKKGQEDKISIVSRKTKQEYEIFSKSGRIHWIAKGKENNIIFSYREGLFNRPYIIDIKEE